VRRIALSRLLWVALLGLHAPAAQADGALPLARQVFLPAAHPHRVVLGTNQGLFVSEDDGSTWRMVPESVVANGNLVFGYQLGPDETVYSVNENGLSISTDLGCTWSQSTFSTSLVPNDLFPDPNDPLTVLVIARPLDFSASRLYRSRDRAAHLDEVLYDDASATLLGVEVPRGEPATVYVSGFTTGDGGQSVPFVARSDDDGHTFSVSAHPELDNQVAWILEADPADADHVYLRVGLSGVDSLQLASDAGSSLTTLLQLPGAMGAFTHGDDGTIWVGDVAGHLWSSQDGGFELQAGPRTMCLGFRGGVLYSCGSRGSDGFDLGKSTDRGHTFLPLLNLLSSQGIVATDCSGGPDGGNADGGQSAHDAGTGAPDGGTRLISPKPMRCACSTGDGGLALLIIAVVARRPRRRH